MNERPTPPWAEALQLLPIITLAFPFIVRGAVDLAQAETGFIVAACLSIACTGIVARRHPLNPILVGTSLWLIVGALAFGLDLGIVTAWLGETQAFGLFAAALLVGIATTWASPYGYIGARLSPRSTLLTLSIRLLGMTALVVVWAWFFRHDVRLGGGLPFIALNVARRVMLRRATSAPA